MLPKENHHEITQSWLLPVGQSLLVDGDLDLVLAVADDVEHVRSGWDAGTSLGGPRGPTWSALSQVEGLTMMASISHPTSLVPIPFSQYPGRKRGQKSVHVHAIARVTLSIFTSTLKK